MNQRFLLFKHTFAQICFIILIAFNVNGQQELHHRVKVWTGTEGLMQMAAQGIAVDHGEVKKGVYLISDLSDSEIAKLKEIRLPFEVMIEDVASYYIRRNDSLAADKNYTEAGCIDCPDFSTPVNFKLGSMAGFYTYQELLDVLDSMHHKFPHLVSARQPIGSYTTTDGNKIFYLKISDNPSEEEPEEPQVLYTAIHHAREPQSLTQLIFFMWYMLEQYDVNPEIKYLLDNRALYFVPCINPDGYIHNQNTNPAGGGMWRKNRSKHGPTYGVDLNRNYGSYWGIDYSGSSPDSSSDIFRGPTAFSEIETQAIRDLCLDHQFKIALNAHSYSNMLIYPYGYEFMLKTPDSPTYQCLAEEMTSCNRYNYGSSFETVGYPANGCSDDWMYDSIPQKPKIFALTPEVGNKNDGFWPSINRIIPLAKQMLIQNLSAARQAGAYAEVKHSSKMFYFSNKYYSIPIETKRTGLDFNGQYTVKVNPLTDNIDSVSAPISYSNMAINLSYLDTLVIKLKDYVAAPANIRYAIEWRHDSGAMGADTFSAWYGVLDTVYYNDCNSKDNFERTMWGTSTTHFVSAPFSVHESIEGLSPNDANSKIVTKEWIDLTNIKGPVLSFYAKWDIQDMYDYIAVYADIEGGGSTSLCGHFTKPGSDYQDNLSGIYDGKQEEWIREEMDLSHLVGKKIKIRFQYKSDGSNSGEGFYLDDIMVTSISSNRQPNENTQDWCYPNPATDHITVLMQYISPDEMGHIYIYDMIGKQVWEQSIDVASPKVSVNISNLTPGVYLVKVQGKFGVSKVKKVVVKH